MPALTTDTQKLCFCGVDSGRAGKAVPVAVLTFPFDEEEGKFLHFLRVCDAHLSTHFL